MDTREEIIQKLSTERARISRSVLALNTRKSYGYDWKSFTTWCEKMNYAALPATSETVILYLTDLLTRGRKLNTIRQHLSAIKDAHREKTLPSPAVPESKLFLEGAERLLGQQPRQMKPITIDDLQRMCKHLEGTMPIQVRNRAILTLGFATALRQCNLVALDFEDVRFVQQGITVHVRKEKQDQKGVGRVVGIVYGKHPEICPVLTLQEWLKIRGQKAGPLFTSCANGRPELLRLGRRFVWNLVKETVAAIGLDPKDYGAHSLRSGFVTAAVEAGVNEFVIAAHTGHRSLSSLRMYFREANAFRVNASALIGL